MEITKINFGKVIKGSVKMEGCLIVDPEYKARPMTVGGGDP